MKILIFGKSPISENKSIIKITMFIPNTRITRKSLTSGYDFFFTFTNPYGKYLQIFRRTMALGSTQPLTNEYQEYFLGAKGGRCVRLTTLSPSYVDRLELWESQPPGTLRALYRDCFIFKYLHLLKRLITANYGGVEIELHLFFYSVLNR